MIAYKLLRCMADGSLAPLFIDKRSRLELGVWYKSQCIPTKGFAVRQGYHTLLQPVAPHLKEEGRVWAEVEIQDYEFFHRPECQGGKWALADKMRVLRLI